MKTKMLFLTASVFSTFIAFGQSRSNFYIEGNAVFGEVFNGYGANIVSADLAYTYSILPLLQLGAGLGIGKANMLMNPIGEIERDTKTAYAFFGRIKYNFKPKPISMFCQLDGGYNNSAVNDPQDKSYNGLGGFISPAVGCDFAVNRKQKLFFAVGFPIQSFEYSEVTYKLNTAETAFIYDTHIQIREWYTGIKLTLGYIF